jgi:hypothetical protein
MAGMNVTPRSRTALAVVAAVVVFAVIAIAVWRLDSGSTDHHAAPPHVASTASIGVAARVVTPETLRSISRALGRPLYWAGQRRPARLEYTQASDGSTYVRYLTGSARAGAKGSDYVVVATYAQPDASARVLSIAHRKHFTIEHLSNGAVAVTDPKSPRNIHLVFGAQPYQVEIYAPSPEEARRIVRAGAVRPVA